MTGHYQQSRMIALFLMLAAQAAAPAPDAAPPASPTPPPTKVCRQAPGSDTVECKAVPQQQLGYRLPRYGPAAPKASGKGVKVGAQATNRGPTRRNRKMATVGIPF
jgi:hypothetical protein